MGVPKFFRWIAERYPTVITPFKDSPPPVDNLYLDMNGIIHNCTHPNDIDATRKSATEKEMVQAIFSYLEKLFQVIQPKKYFLMAVDGVAPRAKMNQQRQRRYRSGYEMMVAREEATKRGEEIPEEGDVFDSNCITPGTDFMVRLSEHFKYFVAMKIQTDSAWQSCQVIFSGHDHPGEGEHKIVDFIRRRKMQPDYFPNETHCMYGLDADLVMLSLATHEPHFILLREVVSFGTPMQSKNQKLRQEEDEAKGIKEDTSYQKADEFVLFHVNILREFFDVDLRNRLEKFSKVPKDYDLERVVDDFVFMCFFIGNDFLPAIPTLAINDGGMQTMMDIYCEKVLGNPAGSSYLIRDRKINWNSAEVFLSALGELELDTLRARQDEEAEFQKKKSKREHDHSVKSSFNATPITNMIDYKESFYRNKHRFDAGYDPRGPEMTDLRLHYLEGISWVFEYYYQGPPSWKWFFPHHYAPLASDLVNCSAVAGRIRFDKGQPFLPHQQLLAVLPPMSYLSIPKAYWPLLRSKSSPMSKFYPQHIEIDREGAHNPWEGIVIIPFIDEKILLAAYESVQAAITEEDKVNNRLGLPILFKQNRALEPYTLPSSMFMALQNLQVQRSIYEFPASPNFVPRLCPGARTGALEVEGFGSLNSKIGMCSPVFEIGVINIFGMPTRKESMLLELNEPVTTIDEAFNLIGQEVLVGFPHYKRARVNSVCDRRKSTHATFDNNGNFEGVSTRDLTGDEMHTFRRDIEAHAQSAKSKLGIILNEIHVLVYVQRFVGMRLTRKGKIVRQFARTETCYPLQLICKLDRMKIMEDARYVERDRESESDIGAKVVYIGPELKNNPSNMSIYGSVGFAMEQTKKEDEFFAVVVNVYENRQNIPQSLIDYATTSNWQSLHQVAESLQINALALTMCCSSLITTPHYGSQEIGLCIKFTGKNLARVGFCKLVQHSVNPWYVGAPNIFQRMEDDKPTTQDYFTEPKPEGNEKGKFSPGGKTSSNNSGSGTWYFSQIAVQLISEYVQRFAPLIRRLAAGGCNSSQLDPSAFLTDKWQQSTPESVLLEITSFLAQSKIMEVPMINATEDAFTRGHIKELEELLTKTTPRASKEFIMRNVAQKNLYFPTVTTSNYAVAMPLPKDQKFQIGSRVVYCRTTGAVPFGASGTVVRMLASGHEAEVIYDNAWVEGNLLGGRLTSNRGALTKLAALLVVSQLGESQGLQVQKPRTPLTENPITQREGSVTISGGSSGINLAQLKRVSPTVPVQVASGFPAVVGTVQPSTKSTNSTGSPQLRTPVTANGTGEPSGKPVARLGKNTTTTTSPKTPAFEDTPPTTTTTTTTTVRPSATVAAYTPLDVAQRFQQLLNYHLNEKLKQYN